METTTLKKIIFDEDIQTYSDETGNKIIEVSS